MPIDLTQEVVQGLFTPRITGALEALSDGNRRAIVDLLQSSGPSSFTFVQHKLEIASNLLAAHLRRLQESGLAWKVRVVDSNYSSYYELTPFGHQFLNLLGVVKLFTATSERPRLREIVARVEENFSSCGVLDVSEVNAGAKKPRRLPLQISARFHSAFGFTHVGRSSTA